ncbi:hypothetical protein N7470_006244 [Penicillium chermesinum]|nr:hypothetical protein N7470_006244 [Penicillium chermesinum]
MAQFFRRWVTIAFFLQCISALTITVELPTDIGTPTPTSSVIHSHHPGHHHHWTYTPNPHPSRKRCAKRSSSISSKPATAPTKVATSNSALHSSKATIAPSGVYPSDAKQSRTEIAPPTQTGTTQSFGEFLSSSLPLKQTTRTVFTTRTATITACPTTVIKCPASARETYVTTETIVLSTTVCPMTVAATTTLRNSAPFAPGVSIGGNGDEGEWVSTDFITRTVTVTACPESVTNCPVRSKTAYTTTETLVDVITSSVSGSPATGVNAKPTSISDVGGSAWSNAGETKTVTLESCGGNSCSNYDSVVTVAVTFIKTGTLLPQITAPSGSGAGIGGGQLSHASSSSLWRTARQTSVQSTATPSVSTPSTPALSPLSMVPHHSMVYHLS